MPVISFISVNTQGLVVVVTGLVDLQGFRDVSATLRFGHSTFRPQTIFLCFIAAKFEHLIISVIEISPEIILVVVDLRLS
jgi:hypothetical protein